MKLEEPGSWMRRRKVGTAPRIHRIGRETHGCGSDFQDCCHRDFSVSTQSGAHPLRRDEINHNDHPGGAGSGADDCGARDQHAV